MILSDEIKYPEYSVPQVQIVKIDTIDEIKTRHTPSVMQLQQDYQIWFQNQGEGEQQFTIPYKHPQM